MSSKDRQQIQERANELLKLTIVSTGSYLATKLFFRLVSNPLMLFGTGVVSGVYLHKNRKQIIETLSEAKQQAQQLLGKSDGE